MKSPGKSFNKTTNYSSTRKYMCDTLIHVRLGKYSGHVRFMIDILHDLIYLAIVVCLYIL